MNAATKNTLNLCGLMIVSLALTGCIIAIGTGKETTVTPPIIVTDSADAASIAEINAAAKLNMDSDRTHVLGQIAERPGLTASVQVHLVNVVYRDLDMDNNRTLVLTKIIARSDFSDATRHAIVSQLSKLSFDSDRQIILQQINERLKKPAAQ